MRSTWVMIGNFRTILKTVASAGSMLIITIVFTGLFGFYQESVNTAIMEGFKKMVPSYATVVREGSAVMVPSEEVVIGDVVRIQAGDVVPGDIRIIESKGRHINFLSTGKSSLYL